MKHDRIALVALLCALMLLCAGCARGLHNYLPETSPAREGAENTAPAAPAEQTALPEKTQSDERDRLAAYLGVLIAEREAILGYDWQRGLVFDKETYETRPAETATPVVFADVWGDGTPELIYLSSVEHEGFRYAAKLHVFTWDDGGVRELRGGDMEDSQVGGGSSYRMFRLAGDKALWIYSAAYSEGIEESYSRFTTEGSMRRETVCVHTSFPVEDDGSEEGWRIEDHYMLGDETCTSEAYEAAVPTEEKQAKGLLMRNALYYEYDADAEKPEDAFDYSPDGEAMTYDDAVAYLRGELGITPDTHVDEQAFFASLPGSFSFCSGAGAWSTELSLNPDGTFTGNYHDSDMGDDGEGYPNGTVYVCSFSGAFGRVRRVDEYTYSMHLERINIVPTPAEEWIEDGVRYVASDPYGLDDADEILVYLPGAWMRSLPYSFKSWVSMPRAWGLDDQPVLLPFYGLLNVNAQEGWSGGE